MKNSLLLLLCFALVLSCKKDNTSSPSSSGGPTTPTTSAVCGNGSFIANGTTIYHNGLMPNNDCAPSAMGRSPFDSNIVGVAADLISYSNSGLFEYILTISYAGTEEIVTGVTYTDGFPDNQFLCTYTVSNTITYQNVISSTPGTPNYNGEVTFTKLDLVDSLISGTFSFTGYDVVDSTNTVVVTNGTFQDLPCMILW